MKKLFVICMLTCFCLSCFAQATFQLNDVKRKTMFKAQFNGFVGEYGDYSFVILPMKGMSAKKLYDKMILGLNNTYMDFDNVVTKIENAAITINAYYKVEKSGKSLYMKDGIAYYIEGFKYRFSFKFKDGKVRVDAPIVSSIDYFPEHNESEKKQGNLANVGTRGASTVGMFVSIILNDILDTSYNAKADDNW